MAKATGEAFDARFDGGSGWSPLRRIGERLWVADLGGLLFEIGLVWWPLLAYLLSAPPTMNTALAMGKSATETRDFLFRVAPAIVVLLEAPWWIVVGPRRAALVRAMAIRNSGRPLPTELRRRVMRALDGLPPLGLWLRAGLVGVGAAGLLQLSAMRGLIERDLATLLGVVACGHAFCASALRAAWYDRLLDRRESRLFPDDDPIDRFARRYRRRVQLESLAIGVSALIQIGIYTLVFVPIGKTLFAELELLVVLVGFVLLAIWGVVIERVARPIDRYFAVEHNRSTPGADDRPDEQTAKERAQLAYRSGAKLPLALAAAKLGTLLLGIGLVLFLSHRLLPVDREEAGLLGGAATLLALAVSLYEALAQHSIMRPLRIHLASRHRLALSDLGPTMSLRSKMVASFGLLAIFSAGISLYLSFIHYKALATRFIQRETELRLQSMARSLDGKSATGGRLSDGAISEELRRFAIELERSVDEPAIVFFPTGGKPLSFGHLSGEQLSDLATLQPPLQSRLIGRSGRIDLPSHRWAGSFLTLTLAGESRGQIALLQPGYRGRGTSTAPQIRILVVFFVFLIIGSLIVVFIAARDLTAPLRTLEQRAQALAAGDLSRAIPPSGEADEVGSLTLQFEEMRRGLYDRLRSSTEINLALEQEVQKRTSELEGRNVELAQALDALRRAQDELVRAEKLASMGRLVAGIAHEINNPVNAIANTAGPLEQALRTLGAAPLSPEDRDELLAMLSVIQRGAKRTSEIVHALHSYSRREDDRIGDVDLNRVLDETLDLLRHQLKGITVTKHYQPRAIARGNTGQLGQVFMNLITNAAQAITDAGASGNIELRTSFADGRIKVEVSDDGPGIPDEVRQRIFDPFFTTKDVGQGSGLGLSIVQSLIDRHGGHVTVETKTQPPQRGTKFTVDLPRGAG